MGRGQLRSAKGSAKSAERPLGVAATRPQPHSDLTHQCNAAAVLKSMVGRSLKVFSPPADDGDRPLEMLLIQFCMGRSGRWVVREGATVLWKI